MSRSRPPSTFAQNLKADATVLVADFRRRRSTYSLIRFETVAGQLKATPIGHSGVGIAGDHFDARIIDNVVAPEIGKRSFQELRPRSAEVPTNYYSSFSRWNQLSIFKTSREYEDLEARQDRTRTEKLELFIDLVDRRRLPLYPGRVGHEMALSAADEAEFNFSPLGRAEKRMVARADFESWISDDLARIEGIAR